MKKRIALIIETLACLSLAIFLVISAIAFTCFDKTFYAKQFSSLEVAKTMGISQEDTLKMRDCLLLYLEDKGANLDLEIKKNGQLIKAFNEREIAHMSDVKNLWLATKKVQIIALFSGILLLFVAYPLAKNSFLITLKKAIITAITILIISVLVIFLNILIGFDYFWTNFHKLFFNNDLWLLDPSTDLLINLVPPPFFFALLKKIIFLAILLLLTPLIIVKLAIKERL